MNVLQCPPNQQGMTIPGLRTFEVPCGRGYDVIYGLAQGREQTIYISVSNEFAPGSCACVWIFDAQTERFRKVIDLAKETGYQCDSGQMPHSKVHLSLQATSDGRVFAATHFTAPAPGQQDFDPIEAYRRGYEGSYVIEYDPDHDRTVNYGCLLPHEGCRISALDEAHGFLYLLSYPKNHLYRFHYSNRTLSDLGRLGQENSFGLEVADDGTVFTTDDLGRFLRLASDSDQIEELDSYAPLKPGRRRQGNYVRRMIKGLDGFLYGFGNKGMHLFRFCTRTATVTDLGVIFGTEAKTDYAYPTLPPAKAIAQADPDGLYVAFGGDGIYADRRPVPSLVRYDLSSRTSKELGRFIDEQGVPAWIPQCALYSKAGNAMYFGMQQVVGGLRLWKLELGTFHQPPLAAASHVLLQAHELKVRSAPFGTSVEGHSQLPFLTEGHVSLIALGWPGEGLVIPPGESAISDLLFADHVYGVTRGRKSHVFRYAPYAHNRFLENYDVHVCDLGTVSDRPVSQARILVRTRTGELVMVLRSDNEIRLILYDRSLENKTYRAHYHSIPHWAPFHSSANPFRNVCSLHPHGASLNNLIYDRFHDCIYSTDAVGQTIRLKLDSGETQAVGVNLGLVSGSFIRIDSNRFFALASDGAGLVIRCSDHLEIERASPRCEPPVVSCGAYNAQAGVTVLGTEDGRLISYNIIQPKPSQTVVLPGGRKIRALTSGHGATVYGYCGADDSIGEVFALDLCAQQARLCGIAQVTSDPRFWITHRCDCAVLGRQGEVYFGEADRISHLLVYWPPAELKFAP